MSSRLGALLGQKQVVELDDDIGKVGELHEVRGDDVDPVHPRPLSLDPGNDGWQVPGAAREDKSENMSATQHLALKEKKQLAQCQVFKSFKVEVITLPKKCC